MNINELITYLEKYDYGLTYLEAMKVVKLSSKTDNVDKSIDELIIEVLSGAE